MIIASETVKTYGENAEITGLCNWFEKMWKVWIMWIIFNKNP